MKTRAIFFILFLLVIPKIKAQEMSFTAVDTKTYRQYLEKDWTALIKTGKKALKNGINFYYLQNRMGIAYFETGKYRQAARFFENSLKMSKDDYIKEMLYLSYLYGGMTTNASSLSEKLPPHLRKDLKINSKLKDVNFSVFFEKTDNQTLLTDDINGAEDLSGEQEFSNYRWSPAINFQIAKKNGRSLFSYKFLYSNNTYRRQTGTESPKNFTTNIKQHQFYHLKSIFLSSKLSLEYALSLTPGTAQNVSLSTTFSRIRQNQENYTISNSLFFNWITNLGVSYHSAYYSFNLNTSYGKLNTQNIFQIELTPTIYPSANLNFYISPRWIWQLTNEKNISLTAGKKIVKNLWLEISYLQNEIPNFASNNAYILYNSNELIKNTASLSLILPLKDKKITLSYIRQNKDYPYTYDISATQNTMRYLNANTNLFYIQLIF